MMKTGNCTLETQIKAIDVLTTILNNNEKLLRRSINQMYMITIKHFPVPFIPIQSDDVDRRNLRTKFKPINNNRRKIRKKTYWKLWCIT